MRQHLWFSRPYSMPLKLLGLIISLVNRERGGISKQASVLVLIKLTQFAVPVRLRCGCSKLTFCLYFIIFAMFKNVVHSLEPGETPSNSASHQAPNYVQCC